MKFGISIHITKLHIGIKKTTWSNRMKCGTRIFETKLKYGNTNQSVIMAEFICNIYAGWWVN